MDCRNLLAYRGTHKLYDQLVKYPQEIIPLMDHTIRTFYADLYHVQDDVYEQLKIRPFNLESNVNMRELDPQSKSFCSMIGKQVIDLYWVHRCGSACYYQGFDDSHFTCYP